MLGLIMSTIHDNIKCEKNNETSWMFCNFIVILYKSVIIIIKSTTFTYLFDGILLDGYLFELYLKVKTVFFCCVYITLLQMYNVR